MITRNEHLAGIVGVVVLGLTAVVVCDSDLLAAEGDQARDSTWPQAYTVERDETRGLLTLRTPYYTVRHDLRRGGVIRQITLTHGRAANLLAGPLASRMEDDQGRVLTDVKDSSPTVRHRREGMKERVEVEAALRDSDAGIQGLRVRTTYEYGWGYVRVHREFIAPPDGLAIRELCPLATVLAATLTDYGYREGLSEEEGAPPFSFGSNRWGKLRRDQPGDAPLRLGHVPRSMMFVDPGVEGLEWFVGSDLSSWELSLANRRGQGRAVLETSRDPLGLAWSISPWWSTNDSAVLKGSCVLDFYLAVPLLEGRAIRPWVHTSFNRNRGEWVSAAAIQHWAEQGYQTVHCHNDGDYYGDGLFWRDGSYPPYPDMDGYDGVLRECRRVGLRTATYFSNKELHPSTAEFREHGQAWGRQNRAGQLQHNFFRPQSEFGAQMCLRSGWLEFLKHSIDRVLRNHPLDGVYYDWNVALFCCNPNHEPDTPEGGGGRGHWDMDELLDLMEWTRQRVGPDGLVIVHNTTTPMFALENFANHVVATEWGYGKWTTGAPDLTGLPLEWSLAGARSRGVISYGTIDAQAPQRLHRVFALQAFLGGVTPWPASPQTFDLLPLFKPLGDLAQYRFADWRNQAVRLSDKNCASAIYSRPGEAYLMLANLTADSQEVTVQLDPAKLPFRLEQVDRATRLSAASADSKQKEADTDLDADSLTHNGVKISLAGDDAVMIRVRATAQ